MKRLAWLSDCGTYRYALYRRWSEGCNPDNYKVLTFIMLNPSTADGYKDDPTVRKCIGFAMKLGFDAIWVLNLYALRSTDPKGLWKHGDPVGPDNDEHLRTMIEKGDTVIAAWGAHAKPERVAEVVKLLPKMQCLGYTKGRQPRHPLMLAYTTPLIPFEVPNV